MTKANGNKMETAGSDGIAEGGKFYLSPRQYRAFASRLVKKHDINAVLVSL